MTEKYDVFIKNGDVVIGQCIEKLNIGIKDQKITLLTTNTNYEAEEVIDAKNLTIMPGVIDSQVHFREPGSEHKEDMNTGTKGAALGGVTSIFEMPNTYPPTATVELLNDKFELAKYIKNNIYGKKIVIGMGAGSISTWMRELPKLL